MTSLVAAVGVAFPDSLVGKPVHDLAGAGGAPALVAWPAWVTWRLARHKGIRVGQATAWGVLTAAWFVLLALREGAVAGGALGQGLLDALDGGFGRVGGLALVFIGAAAAVVALVGTDRVLLALALLGTVARRLAGPRENLADTGLGRGAKPAEEKARPRPSTAESEAGPAGDIVILGPGGAPAHGDAGTPGRGDTGKETQGKQADSPSLSLSASPRLPASPSPTPPDWLRPDAKLLGAAAEGAAFSPADLKARARVIEETLAHFNVQARVVEVQQGPAITQFGLDPAPGVAVSRIVSRQNDLALRLGAPSLRVLAPVPGRPLVGLEVPNNSVATVKLGDLVSAPTFGKARLPIGIGMDVSGKPVVGDLARMPHLLIAGATGSGKSVSINTLIASLLVSRTPDEVELVLVDPKQVEMSQYKGLPHLRLPVVTDMDKVVATLRWTVLEMERRYTRFSEVGARNIVAFNERFPQERLSYLVIVIDELADMMMTAAEDVERLICRLAQLGRAAGVHLVVATQRPSVDVLTGLIKANLPTRIAFAVSSQTDSRVILDRAGAERLLGRGDALYQAGDEMNPRRVQGAFVSDDEIEALCTHWRGQGVARHTQEDEEQLEKLARQDDPEEKLLAQARQILAEKGGDVTPAYLARRLKIGTPKAARIHQRLVADDAAARALPPTE
jgi:S-DNA-T family DNA segregation ATPase FtsK/SpoIIIE